MNATISAPAQPPTQSPMLASAPASRQFVQSIIQWMPANGGRGQLGTSSATLYTAPSGSTPTGNTQKARLKKLLLNNTDSAARTVTIYLIESGGSVADNRAILKTVSIPATTLWVLDFGPDGITLEGLETVRGLASTANVVTYRVDVEEMMLLA